MVYVYVVVEYAEYCTRRPPRKVILILLGYSFLGNSRQTYRTPNASHGRQKRSEKRRSRCSSLGSAPIRTQQPDFVRIGRKLYKEHTPYVKFHPPGVPRPHIFYIVDVFSYLNMPPVLTRPKSRDYLGVVDALMLIQPGIDAMANGYSGLFLS